MASTDVLLRLQAWYADQSDGEWEHSYGVRIDTLDNPGWAVRIDLNGTSVEDRALDREEVHRSEEDWLVVWRDDAAQWHAACGPHNLEEAVERFLSWARPDDLASTSATLESSNGNASLTLRRVGDVLYAELRWVAQAWELDDPPASTLTLYRVGIPDTLRSLSNDLRAHLARPLAELAGSPFTGSYDLGARTRTDQPRLLRGPRRIRVHPLQRMVSTRRTSSRARSPSSSRSEWPSPTGSRSPGTSHSQRPSTTPARSRSRATRRTPDRRARRG